ncbi:glycerophosphodiester phosphodiesterase [Sporosarcina sp. P21c]|uniref:glycerophosphodiester phosphodiesterase n=1 Tax=unclassified Sporosarcina TaxID=2647733 RepID=UPI000C16FD99|nr:MULTISPECIES: glycerophosphodiester phosphodiesterase family protein [unclassified Sporosarcina]PIC66899.1 glycerophosphodiester phosphodiesterase [Sporosarcina sp. P16a]PIC89400.1 glycerophosphodiester phosphodiesterase [Sporosarcina sp. P21c]PIC92351.1 glycerophosphodiester phosphodiesterase [Sporosarcina sp. P25]
MSESKIFAHRGASGHYFENTMRAFLGAVQKGADGIELDVQQTSDGQLVVIHDNELARLAGIDQHIDQLTSKELQHIKIGKNSYRRMFGHTIPVLFDVVSFCSEHNLALNVELKETVYGQVAALEQILHYVESLSTVHLSSFDYETMRMVKELDSDMETALLLRKKTIDWQNLDVYDVDAFHFHKRLWKDPFKRQLLESGKILRMYGVTGAESFLSDTPEVTGWITDYPKRVRKKIKGSR